MSKTLIINKEECAKLLTYERCIPAMRDALVSISGKDAVVLQRQMIPHEGGNCLAIMPASSMSEKVTGGKVIIFPGPATYQAGTSQGIVPLFSTETGELLAITDAHVMTTIRTSSTSAAATDVLARKDAKNLAIVGSGNQGRAHALAISKVRDLKRIYVTDMMESSVVSCVEYLKEYLEGVEIIPCASAEEAVKEADIICTTTAGRSAEPVLKQEWVKEGVHINAVGACVPFGIECDTEILHKSRVYTDWTEAAARDSGDLAIPIASGMYKVEQIIGEVGQVISGEIEGRTSDTDNTFFETVGISVQDLISANIIYKAAKEKGMGIAVQI